MPKLPKLLAASALTAALFGTAAAPALASTASVGATTAHHLTAKPHKVKKAHKPKKGAKKAAAKANLTAFESALLSDMNAARAQAGLAPLVAEPGTTDVARRWALHMAKAGDLSHNPDVFTQLQSAGSGAWTHIEENVGAGPANDEQTLFAAYMASPHHHDNIMNPAVKYVGVGVLQVNSAGGPTAYNVVDFTDAYSPSYGADRTPGIPSVVDLSAAAATLGN